VAAGPQRRPGPPSGAVLVVSRAVADIGAILIGLVVADGLQASITALPGSPGQRVDTVSTFNLLTIAAWLWVFAAHGMYDQRRLVNAWDEFKLVIASVSSGTVVAVFGAVVLRVPAHRTWILATWAGCTTTLLLTRFAQRRLLRSLRRSGALVSRMLIVGAGREGQQLWHALNRSRYLGFRVVGFLDDEPADRHGPGLPPVLGSTSDVAGKVREHDVQAVLVAGGSVATATAERVYRELDGLGVDLHLSTGLLGVAANRVAVQRFDGIPVLALRRVELTRAQRFVKRAFDLVAGSLLLAASLPLLAACALAVACTGRPVLFRQERAGRGGRVFGLWKFRSMTVDAEQRLAELVGRNEIDGPYFKLRDDPRVTRVGRVLRAWSLDELPQLFNVVRGEMSLVGPRPQKIDEVDRADLLDPRAPGRLRVKPGLSGLWQVSGRHSLSSADRVRYDLFYVDNWSLGMDVFILLRTIPTVLRRSGV
jgi:exopolysaccharide biosynthesis polyprenyl glycosylphosphotransferase